MISKKQYKTGFTLVEALVSIAIVSVIMSSVLFDYATFTDNLALSSAGQELAVAIRQAQTYGLTVKEVSVGGGQFNSAYGVYFNVADPTNYYIFADYPINPPLPGGNHLYDIGSGCGSGPTNTECVDKITMRNNIKISNVCDGSSCAPSGSTQMQATFLRPNPDAVIYFTGGSSDIGPSLTGKVVLISPRGKTLTVTIESTGQVLVGPIV